MGDFSKSILLITVLCTPARILVDHAEADFFSRAAIGAPNHHERPNRCIVGKDDIARPLFASFSNPQIPSRPHDGNVFPIPPLFTPDQPPFFIGLRRGMPTSISAICPTVSNPLFVPDGICTRGDCARKHPSKHSNRSDGAPAKVAAPAPAANQLCSRRMTGSWFTVPS